MQLCSHHVTDRNQYAICRYILSPNYAHSQTRHRVKGLLHDVPPEIDNLHSITELVDACSRPTRPGERFDASVQLVNALTELVTFDSS